MAKTTAKAKQKPNLFKKLVKKATSTRRAIFITGLAGILVFSGIGAYLIEKSSALTADASTCGAGFIKYYTGQAINPSNGRALASKRLYFKQTSGDTYRLCAVYTSLDNANGVAKPMSVSWYPGGQSDSGQYKHYAGPVYATVKAQSNGIVPCGLNGNINGATVSMTWNGKKYSDQAGSYSSWKTTYDGNYGLCV